MSNATKYIVMTRSTKMPCSVKSTYRKVAVVEIDPNKLPEGRSEPFAITDRSRGVVRVVEVWDKLFVGKTAKCAYARAIDKAEELVHKLESERDPAVLVRMDVLMEQGMDRDEALDAACAEL